MTLSLYLNKLPMKTITFILSILFSATVFSAKLSLLRQARNTGKSKRYDRSGKMEWLALWNLAGIRCRFFDTAEETLEEEIQKELRRVCFYLNLNARQSLLLFQDVYCDYQLVANHLYNFMKRKYRDSFYLAVSRKFEGCECLPEVLEQLEQQMEEKFYHPEKHVFSNEDDVLKLSVGEVQDSQIMQMISEDITRKDTDQLRKHFACLKEKYHDNTKYSAMYIKFVFSNVIQELFQENQFSGERRLEHEIERLYNCRNIMEILEVTEDNIKEYEAFLDRSMSSSRNEVAAVKNYIYQHYEEDLNLEMLAEKVYLSSGYLSFNLQKETGNEFEPIYTCVPDGEGKRTSLQHQYEGGTGQ